VSRYGGCFAHPLATSTTLRGLLLVNKEGQKGATAGDGSGGDDGSGGGGSQRAKYVLMDGAHRAAMLVQAGVQAVDVVVIERGVDPSGSQVCLIRLICLICDGRHSSCSFPLPYAHLALCAPPYSIRPTSNTLQHYPSPHATRCPRAAPDRPATAPLTSWHSASVV